MPTRVTTLSPSWKQPHASMGGQSVSGSTTDSSSCLAISTCGAGSTASCWTTRVGQAHRQRVRRRLQQPRPAGMPERILVLEPRRRPVQDRGVAGRIQYRSPTQRDGPCATGRTRAIIGCSMLQPMIGKPDFLAPGGPTTGQAHHVMDSTHSWRSSRVSGQS